MQRRHTIRSIVALTLILASGPAWGQARVTRGGPTSEKDSKSNSDREPPARSSSSGRDSSGPGSSGPGSSGSSRGGSSSQDSGGGGFRGSPSPGPYRQPEVFIRPPPATPQPYPPTVPFPWPPDGGGGGGNSGNSSRSSNYYHDRQRDERLQALENELLKNQILDAKLRRDLLRPPGAMMPPPAAPVAVQGDIFSIGFGGCRVREQTADDDAVDGPGDEALVCLMFGYYDARQDLFAFLPPLKSAISTRLEKGDQIPLTAIADAPLEIYLELRRHLLLVIPTVWEVDREADESLDRASRLHDLIFACSADIHTEIRGLRHDINGVKSGREIGLPFIGGTTGGNRPIGMKQANKGGVTFCPSALLIDFKEAQAIAKKGSQSIVYKDDPATELGGAYEIKIDVTRVR